MKHEVKVPPPLSSVRVLLHWGERLRWRQPLYLCLGVIGCTAPSQHSHSGADAAITPCAPEVHQY